jgi:hypothetical protein
VGLHPPGERADRRGGRRRRASGDPRVAQARRAPPRRVGALLLSVCGLGVFLFGVIEGPDRGWLEPEVLLALVTGVVLIGGFVLRELRADAPLFDVRILRRRTVSAGSTNLFTAYWLFTGMLFLFPSWLQEVQRESIVDVGLLLVPFAVVFGLLSMRSTVILAKLGERAAIAGACSCARSGNGSARDRRARGLVRVRGGDRRARGRTPAADRAAVDGGDERTAGCRGG